MFETPPKLDFVMPGFLVGSVGCIVSEKPIGKSMLAFELALSVASGFDISGLWGGQPITSGYVTYLAANDPDEAISERIYSMGKYLSEGCRNQAIDNLTIIPMYGRSKPDLEQQEGRHEIVDYSKGKRLLVIDTLRMFHTMDDTNSEQMAYLVDRLNNIARCFSCAILLVFPSHCSTLMDYMRWSLELTHHPDDGDLLKRSASDETYSVIRADFTSGSFDSGIKSILMRRVSGGVLVPIDRIHD